MKPSLVIAHIFTEPQPDVSNLKEQATKFLEDRRESILKRLYLRSSVPPILENAIAGTSKPENAESCQSDETKDGSEQNETTESTLFCDYSKRAEAWGEGNVISVDVTRVAILQAMEQSPTDTWDSSKLHHFLTNDGFLTTSRNLTESKNWWDRPLWAWKRNELLLAHGAMLAVEMMEGLNLSSSQKVKVAVSNAKDVSKIATSGNWSYRIALFGKAKDWDYDGETQKVGGVLPIGSSRRFVSPADNEINSSMREIDESELNQDCDDERHGNGEIQVCAEVSISQGIDLHDTILIGSNHDEKHCKPSSPGATARLVNIPVTMSPEDSIAPKEPNENIEHASELSLESAIEAPLLSLSSISKSSPPNSRNSLIMTQVKKKDRPLKKSHDSLVNQSENTSSSQRDEMKNLVATPDEACDIENPQSTPVQQPKLKSAAVSPSHTQEVEEEYRVRRKEYSDERLDGVEDLSDSSSRPSRDIASKSPQFDSQGIDLSMLSQIPQELRSEARLALAVNRPRRLRKRLRTPQDSQLYKWLSSSSSKSSKIPRTQNAFVEDKKRPSNITDFFPTT
ncbi:MAG: hypothetical protein SGBAC_003514 [Bacillariaceae sp.]